MTGPHNGTYDAVVVRGGAAGLSATVVLGRQRRTVLPVDAGEPRNAPAEQELFRADLPAPPRP